MIMKMAITTEKKKSFMGFKTVTTKNANETYQTDTYYMDEYYKKGAIKERFSMIVMILF